MAVPVGTSLATILSDYRGEILLGLYTVPVVTCPPPAYFALVQPNYPRYNPVPAFSLENPVIDAVVEQAAVAAQTAGAGLPDSDTPASLFTLDQSVAPSARIRAAFRIPSYVPPGSVVGWFAFVRVADGSNQVVYARAFPFVVNLTERASTVIISTTVAVGVGQGPAAPSGGNLDVVSVDATVLQSSGGVEMANLLRGTQRASAVSERKIAANISFWDANVGNLPKSSKLCPVPLLTGVVTTVVKTAGSPPVFYTADELLSLVDGIEEEMLAAKVPVTPP